MGKIFKLIIITASLILWSCNGSGPTKNDIVGNWKSVTKAELIFNSNGTFTGASIPAVFGFWSNDTSKDAIFNGSGKWALRKSSANWEVYLDFDKVTLPNNGCAFPLLIAGKNGFLENKPPWYLFLWKGEEGGDRYVFLKQ